MIWVFKGSIVLLLVGFLWFYQRVAEVLIEEDVESLLLMTQGPSIIKFQTHRILKCWVACLLIVIAILLDYEASMVSVSALLVYVVFKQPYWLMKAKMKSYRNRLTTEFPIWLRQLQILLQHNTVLVAMELSIPQSPRFIRSYLKVLIEDLKENPLQLSTYSEFMSQYQCVEILRAMKLLYRYNTVGQEDAMRQLNRMITTTGRWLKEKRNEKMQSSSSLNQWWAMAPLIAVTGVFIVMMMQTIVLLLERG